MAIEDGPKKKPPPDSSESIDVVKGEKEGLVREEIRKAAIRRVQPKEKKYGENH